MSNSDSDDSVESVSTDVSKRKKKGPRTHLPKKSEHPPRKRDEQSMEPNALGGEIVGIRFHRKICS